MKATQYFARTVGIIYLLIGVMGLIPTLVKAPAVAADAAGLAVTSGYGDLLGLFPINALHNLVHLLVGVLGILASIALDSSRLYSGVLALFYGGLALMGLFPPTQSTLGIIPIFGNDVWLHAITAAIATYFGFIATPDLAELGNTPPQQPSTGNES
jgi:hypothetical protein